MRNDQREMPPEGSELVNRRAFLRVAAGAVTGVAVASEISEIAHKITSVKIPYDSPQGLAGF